MNKLTKEEFIAFTHLFLLDRIFPDNIHIPGFGIRMPYKSFNEMTEDLYKAYYDNGLQGISEFFQQITNRKDIKLASSFAALTARSRITDEAKIKSFLDIFNKFKAEELTLDEAKYLLANLLKNEPTLSEQEKQGVVKDIYAPDNAKNQDGG